MQMSESTWCAAEGTAEAEAADMVMVDIGEVDPDTLTFDTGTTGLDLHTGVTVSMDPDGGDMVRIGHHIGEAITLHIPTMESIRTPTMENTP